MGKLFGVVIVQVLGNHAVIDEGAKSNIGDTGIGVIPLGVLCSHSTELLNVVNPVKIEKACVKLKQMTNYNLIRPLFELQLFK